jgi:hypothetical protein
MRCVDYFIETVQSLPWQIGLVLLAIWTILITRVIWQRERAFPATMVAQLIKDFGTHRKQGHDHANLLVVHGKEVEELRKDVDSQHKSLAEIAKEDRAEHKQILDKLEALSRSIATLEGRILGRMNGKT